MTIRPPESGQKRRYGVSVLVLSVTASILIGCNAAESEAPPVERPTEPVADISGDSVMQATDETSDPPSELIAMTNGDTDDQSMNTSDGAEVRQAGRHVHGAADLALALDGATISVELESALYNFVGFEHEPETEAQTAALTQANSLLSQPASLLRFNSEADCRAGSVDPVKLMAGGDDHDHSHDDHSHDHDDDAHSDDEAADGHDHGHDHDEGHDHGDDHDHDDHDHAHNNALLTYSFTCSQPNELKWVDLALFDLFENLTEISVVYLGPSQQISETLTPDNQRIQIAG